MYAWRLMELKWNQEFGIKLTHHAISVDGGDSAQQTHFKGVTLHLSARIIAWSPAPAEIE
jgi:hypothetical protein